MAVVLPASPRNEDYEDLVSALISAQGYFKESSVKLDKAGIEILEFDAIATPTNDQWKHSTLVEAKSGSWGFSDLFKLIGWMIYTGREHAVLVHKKSMREDMAVGVADLGSKFDIRCAHIDTGNLVPEQLLPPCREIDPNLKAGVIITARYGSLGRRQSLSYLHSDKEIESEWLAQFKEYRKKVNSSIFIANESSRIKVLYAAWKAEPNLPGKAVESIAKSEGRGADKVWTDLRTDYYKPWLQYAMAFDHVARLRIMRSAIDIVCRDDELGIFEKIGMPQSFLDALKEIGANKYAVQIPYLLQMFFEIFGGFIITNDDRDRELLSQLSGIPVEFIDGCLETYDRFFPTDNGWFFDQDGGVRRAKVVPAMMHGAGCLFRQKIYNLSDYDKLSPEKGWLMSRWHTALYKLVSEVLGEVEDKS